MFALWSVVPSLGYIPVTKLVPVLAGAIPMPHPQKRSIIAIIGATLVLAAPFARGDSVAQTPSMPSQIEREYWEATRQIDSVTAYQAYLNSFPKGFYASLASAAIIKKADNSAPGSVQARSKPTEERRDSPSDAVNAQFSAAKIVGPTGSSAITQQAGDIFRGPGPMTVGWVGARKQIVVPRGDWILLAAEDNLSSPAASFGALAPGGGTGLTLPMSVTTLILARLEGPMIRSFLLAQFNSKGGSPRHSWADALACGATSRSTAFAWRERKLWITQCVEATLHAHTQTNVARTFSGTIWDETLQKLAAGGGSLPRSSYLVTDMFYTGDSSNYLKVSRIDFGVSSAEGGSDVPNSSLDLSLQGRERWARAYSALATLGYRKQITEDDLKAGSLPTTTADLLPD
jgi:hypothetical protein